MRIEFQKFLLLNTTLPHFIGCFIKSTCIMGAMMRQFMGFSLTKFQIIFFLHVCACMCVCMRVCACVYVHACMHGECVCVTMHTCVYHYAYMCVCYVARTLAVNLWLCLNILSYMTFNRLNEVNGEATRRDRICGVLFIVHC